MLAKLKVTPNVDSYKNQFVHKTMKEKKKAIPLKQKSSQWFVSNSMHFMTITCTD